MVQIRSARLEDVPAVAALATQLGYPSTGEQITKRLQGVLGDAAHAAFVAEDSTGKVVGWLHVLATVHLAADPFAEIVGLVVDEAARGRRIGERLVDAAVEWAAAGGYRVLRVRSNVIRADAHRFYERLGFRRKKTQVVFEREP